MKRANETAAVLNKSPDMASSKKGYDSIPAGSEVETVQVMASSEKVVIQQPSGLSETEKYVLELSPEQVSGELKCSFDLILILKLLGHCEVPVMSM